MTMIDERTQTKVWPRRIGVVGLGRMGRAFASNLLADGWSLTVYNRTPTATEEFVAAGATFAANIKDLGDCDLVLSSLADDDALSMVTQGEGGLLDTLRFGAVHVSTSTVSPTLAARIEAAHAAQGQGFIAAPILGNPEMAATRRLYVLLGGAADAVQVVRLLIERMAADVFTIGQNAADACMIKLAANVLTAATLQSVSEVLALLRKGGIDPAVAFAAFTGSIFDGKVHKNYGGKILDQRYIPPGMTMSLAAKDLSLVLACADQMQVPMPLTGLLERRVELALARGWSDLDWSALGLLASRSAGLDEPGSHGREAISATRDA